MIRGGETMPYEFLEDAATADIAFKVYGKDLFELFTAAADATMNVMVEELDSIRPMARRSFSLENEALDMLLFDFLQELIYYKDAEQLLLRVDRLVFREEHGRHLLAAQAAGETIDPERHLTRVDVKAVTLHQFQLQQTPVGWEAMVILDI
jgi:SHS2 domain-containing protein